MPNPILEVSNVSKIFRLNRQGAGSLRQDLKRAWLRAIGKKSTFFGEEEKANKSAKEIRALDEITFNVEEGEVLGILGHNGAGKSTLLKILSRITRPTTGIVKGRGKISSLLEIGTGFHYELSGRENIFISGYMLGLKKQDIHKKFNDIVEFSGVEQFLDMPVKYYSSGMYVRLAFAVAAYLEPDILIIDEVLAVGDAEFQRKCMGKMKEASTQKGRTILFVSHNMQAISNLCSKAMLLQRGKIIATGLPAQVINQYLHSFKTQDWKQEWRQGEGPGNSFISMQSVEIVPQLPDGQSHIDIRTGLSVRFRFYNHTDNIMLSTGLHLFTMADECIFDVCSPSVLHKKGFIEGECLVPGNFLNDGSYYFSIIFVKDTSQPLFYFEQCLRFDVEDYRENMAWYGKWRGYVRPAFTFNLRAAQ
ncbi:MAG TPA: ABC transporter ATP-binding protein [Chitinophagaceae bacterium]